MKSTLAVSCSGPRSSWDPQRQAPQSARVARRWIAAALLSALFLAIAALLMADPAAASVLASV